MKTQALKQALDAGGFDAAFGGARRDEEKSRAKERVYSFRDKHHRWDPKNQRPELWNLYNGRVHKGESIRVFPLSNWTELDVWQYVWLEKIPIVPLYFAAPRPVVERDGTLIMVDDDRFRFEPGEEPEERWSASARSAATRSPARSSRRPTTLPEIIQEMLARHPLRAPGPRHRPRPGRLDGGEEEGGVLLDERTPERAHRHRHRGLPGRARAEGPAALPDLRLGRRRQVDADRPAAARLAADLRGPARRGRGRERRPSARPAASSTSPCSWTASRPSASRASPSTSPTATSRPRGASSSSPTPPATSSTRATWSPGRRPATWRSSSSTPATACRRRPSATATSPRCSASSTSSWPSTRWTSSTGRRSASTRSVRSTWPSPRAST